MQVNIRRRTVILIVVFLLGLVGVLAQSAFTTPAMPTQTDASVSRVAQDLAMAFGQGDLYRSPEKYPLADHLKSSIAKLPNRGQSWPEFVGLTGEVVVVLQGKDSNGQAFTDVVAHVLSKGANASTQLTQMDLRMIQDGGTWKADRLWTLAKGIAQP